MVTLSIDLTQTPADRDWLRAARYERLAQAGDGYSAAVWEKMQEVDMSYKLGDPGEAQRRLLLLNRKHVAPLSRFVEEIRAAMGQGYRVPYFDPCDGGVDARVLVLMEAPGKNAVKTGFVSQDNPDPTARNLFNILFDAGMPRSRMVMWNIVPWYLGTGNHVLAAKATDLQTAKPWLEKLLGLLPRLTVVVFLGRNAQKAGPWLKQKKPGVELRMAYHPSPKALNIVPERRDKIVMAFEEAACLTR